MEFTFPDTQGFSLTAPPRRLSPSLLCFGRYVGTLGVVTPRPAVCSVDGDGEITSGAYGADIGSCDQVCPLSATRFISFGGSGASACTYASGVTFGPAYAFPVGLTSYFSAPLTESKFIVVGRHASSGIDAAFVGVVSGTTITFGAPVTFYSGASSIDGVAALNSGKFVVAYRIGSYALYFLIGTVSGRNISFAPGSGALFPAQVRGLRGIAESDEETLVFGWWSIDYHPFFTAARVTPSGISFSNSLAIGGYYNAAWVAPLLPKVQGLWPKRIVVTAKSAVSPYPARIRGATLSSSMVLAWAGSFQDVSSLSDIGGTRIVSLTDRLGVIDVSWEDAQNNDRDSFYSFLVSPEARAMTFAIGDSISMSDAMRSHPQLVLPETAGCSDMLLKHPRPHFAEDLDAAASAVRQTDFHVALAERLKLAGMVASNQYVLGDDLKIWLYFLEGMDVADAQSAAVSVTLEDLVAAADRLRIGGVFDDPTTRLLTSILRASMAAKRE